MRNDVNQPHSPSVFGRDQQMHQASRLQMKGEKETWLEDFQTSKNGFNTKYLDSFLFYIVFLLLLLFCILNTGPLNK